MARRGLLGGAAAPPLAEAFRLLLGAVPEAMALCDGEGRILAASAALGRLAGPAVALRPGLPVERLVAPADRPALARALAAALAGAPEAAALPARPADPDAPADTAWALRCLPLAPEAGPTARLVLHIADVTAARRAEAAMATAGRLETVGRLAGGIAHDFNNLLGAVLGAAGAAREAGLSPAATAEVATIEDAARRGAGLVRQLLAFARRQQLQPEILELNAAIEGIAPLLRRLLGGRVTLDLALEQPGRRVRVDPGQLDQVIVNLAANAREAMAEGGRLRIATGHRVVLRPEGEGRAALPPGRWVVLEVADTGRGIPPEILPRLFEPFFTTRPDKGGTGLGLATVQGIVAQSGGHISVESVPGQGTCFRIHLPREERPATWAGPTPPAATPAPAPPPPAPAEATGEGPPILLVDDEPALLRLGALVLRRAGHAVLAAESAEAALEALEDAPPPAALVTDVAMPGEDGLALARRLRARFPGLPVLLMSGYAEQAAGQDLAAEGFRFLGKPFAPADLAAAVAALLPGESGHREGTAHPRSGVALP